MQQYRGWAWLLALLALCAGVAWCALRATAKYPALGEPVCYPVNQVAGFSLAIEAPSWSPFRGYTIRWAVAADSPTAYTFSRGSEDAPEFIYLERRVEGQWYRLQDARGTLPWNPVDFTLGGSGSNGLEGSLVQKYDGYGTRLEAGTYRVTAEMRGADGAAHYLAAEFTVA